MSIVISVIDNDEKVVLMFADTRRQQVNSDNTRTIADDAVKAYYINDKTMVGFTGSVMRGAGLLMKLREKSHLLTKELLTIADNVDISPDIIHGRSFTSCFIISGIDENGSPYVWAKSSTNPATVSVPAPGKIVYSCACLDQNSELVAQSAFVDNLVIAGSPVLDYRIAISKAIEAVSLIDLSVSKEHNQLEIKYI
jgi:hypothetical protein